MTLSKKALDISPSMTLAIDAKAKKMKAEGVDVIGFGAGEPDFNTPQYIINAGIEALNKGITRYTPSSGMPDLKKAITEKLKNDQGLDYNPSQIVVSNGGKHSLFNAFQAILNPGDEVLIPSPYWVSYPEMVKMAYAVPVFVETSESNGFKMTVDDLNKKLTDKTKILVINSPCNPTGAVYSSEELRKIADFAIKNDLYVISDEIYEKLVYGGVKHTCIATLGEDIKKRTIVMNGMSKAFAMTGWRIGYVACDEKIAKVITNIQSHSTSNPNSIAQYASITALRGPKDDLNKMVKEFGKRRDILIDLINGIDGLSCKKPDGAFYAFANISKILGKSLNGKVVKSSLDFADMLLDDQKVAVVPGCAFGDDNYIRLSYATSSDNINEGLSRIKKFVEKLK